LFVEKVGQLDFSSLSIAGFSFFEYFFRCVNWKHQKFDQTENNDYTVLSFDLIGIQNLWKIALEATDTVVGKRAIDFLNNLHKNVTNFDVCDNMSQLSPKLIALLSKQRHDYVRMCMGHLAEASKGPTISSQDELRINRCLSLLKVNTKWRNC
jgi:hypothetical protein